MTNDEAMDVLFNAAFLGTEKELAMDEAAVIKAAQALAKQVAEKPKVYTVRPGTILEGTRIECPVCGSDDVVGDYGRNEYEYCPKCGQCIDWGNDDET